MPASFILTFSPYSSRSVPAGNRRFLAGDVFDTFLLPFADDIHEGVDAIQASRKAGVGIHLDQDFPDFADGQAGVQPLVQGRFEFFQITVGGKSSDCNDFFLPEIQRFFLINIHGVCLCTMEYTA